MRKSVEKSNLTKKLLEMGLDEEKVLKIIESHQKRMEKAKQYQKEWYFKVSIAVKKEKVQEIQEQLGVDQQTAKKIAAYEKLKNELSQYLTHEKLERIRNINFWNILNIFNINNSPNSFRSFNDLNSLNVLDNFNNLNNFNVKKSFTG